jgi:hypothetical protein
MHLEFVLHAVLIELLGKLWNDEVLDPVVVLGEAEGEFVDWIDVDILAAVVYRQVNPIYLAPWYKETPWATVARIAKLDICLILAAVTTGYTLKKAKETIRDLQKQLKRSGSRYI